MAAKSSAELRNSGLDSPFSVGGFWDFVVERHRIWHKRTILEQPEPWTDDPILQKFFFCNIFRSLDTGTRWYLDHIDAAMYSWDEILWKTICYRLVNMIEAFETTRGIAPRALWRRMIQAWRDKGIVLHSQAYLTLSRPVDLHNRIDRFEAVLTKLELGFDALVHGIQEAKTLEEVSYCLKQEYGIGPFLSLQIYRDLILANQIPFTDDDWVEVGPGAKPALLMLYGPQAKSVSRQRELVRELAEAQYQALDSRGWNEIDNVYLSICDIEHALCEARKYFNLAAGRGRRRYYRR